MTSRKSLGKKSKRQKGAVARIPARQVHGVVFDTGAEPDLPHHFQVEARALFQPLRFEELVLVVQHPQPLVQFHLDGLHGQLQARRRGDEVARRVDGEAGHFTNRAAGQWIKIGQPFDFVVVEFYADCVALGFSRINVDHIAADPVGGAPQLHVIAGVLQFGQTPQQIALIDAAAAFQEER